MSSVSQISIRPVRRGDVPAIVAMLADDALGRGRERIEDPLPPPYLQAFEKVERDPNIQLVVAEGEGGEIIGCLQLCILPGLSSQGASRGLIEDVRVAAHCRGRRIALGAFALFIRWTLVRGLRRGAIFSRGTGYDIDEQPMMFALVAASHVIIIGFFGRLAAGGDIAGFWRLIAPRWASINRP